MVSDKELQQMWQDVESALYSATGIAFDGCHKIYVLMDEEQYGLMQQYGYELLFPVDDPQESLRQLIDWFGDSCGLRFIESVRTVEGDPNDGFTNLIPQGAADRW
jgi:hypothetical protein